MTHVLTVIAAPGTSILEEASADGLRRVLSAAGAKVGAFAWLSEGEAFDLRFAGLTAERAQALARAHLGDLPVDLAAQALRGRRKRLLLADMESTIIEQEMIDELADAAGVSAQVADITRRARHFWPAGRRTSWRRSAGRMTLHRGAVTLVRTLQRHGVLCVLVSGGFSAFADRIKTRCGFGEVRSNRLLVEEGQITGHVAAPILGRNGKLEVLREITDRLGFAPRLAAAVGDGANDLAMLRQAGLGVGFRPKDIVRRAVRFSIDHGDLTALLYLQGYTRRDFVG